MSYGLKSNYKCYYDLLLTRWYSIPECGWKLLEILNKLYQSHKVNICLCDIELFKDHTLFRLSIHDPRNRRDKNFSILIDNNAPKHVIRQELLATIIMIYKYSRRGR